MSERWFEVLTDRRPNIITIAINIKRTASAMGEQRLVRPYMKEFMQSQLPASRRDWIGLAVLALPTLLVSMDMTILFLAAPKLSAALQPSGTQLLWISDIYGFMLAGVLIPLGAIGDRIGRRKLLLIGAVLFAAASTLAAYSDSSVALIVARALLGIAGATLLPSTLALIRNMFHVPRQRSIAIGLWATSFTLGGVIGPIVGGYLLEHFWWGSVFLIGVPIMLALIALGPVFLPEFREQEEQSIDSISVAQSIFALLSITYAIKHGSEHGVTLSGSAVLVSGFLVGAMFVRRQRHLPQALIDIRLFKNPAFTAAIGANTVALFAWSSASLLVAQYLQLVIGLPPLKAALWIIPPAIASAVGCLVAPMLAGRHSPTVIVGGSLLVTTVGLVFLALFSAGIGLPAVIVGMTGLGFGVAGIVTLGTDLVLTTTAPEKAGAASAISETGADLGGALGVALLGSISAAIYRMNVVIPESIDPNQGAAAKDTLGAAASISANLPEVLAGQLLTSAQSAFVRGLEVAMSAGSVLLLATTILFCWRMRRREVTSLPTSIQGESDVQ